MQKQAVWQIVSSEEGKEEWVDKNTDKDKKANNAGPNKSTENQVEK